MERNIKIREDLKVSSVASQIEVKQLKWQGMNNNRIPRRCLEARMEGRRTRGRPRKTWTDNIIAAGQKRGKSLAEMNRLVPERKEWKRLAERNPMPQRQNGKGKEEEVNIAKLKIEQLKLALQFTCNELKSKRVTHIGC